MFTLAVAVSELTSPSGGILDVVAGASGVLLLALLAAVLLRRRDRAARTVLITDAEGRSLYGTDWEFGDTAGGRTVLSVTIGGDRHVFHAASLRELMDEAEARGVTTPERHARDTAGGAR